MPSTPPPPAALLALRDPAPLLERVRREWGGQHALWVFGYASLIWRPEFEAQIGERAARQQIAEQGAADIMARTTLSTGGIGALTGGGALGSAFQRVTTGAKGGIIGAIGRDAAKEVGQELLQSGGERAVQNVATRDYLDPNQSVMQGVASDALSGAAIGGVMGGVTGGGSY